MVQEGIAIGSHKIVLQSALAPAKDLTAAERSDLREATLDRVQQKAAETLKGHVNLTTRDLIPSDLGVTNDEWNEVSGIAGDTYENTAITGSSTFTLANQRFVGFYGIQDQSPNPIVTKLRLTIGSHINTVISLMHIAEHTPREGYLRSPIIISENMAVKIERYLRGLSGYVTTMGTVRIVFLGFTVEPAGRTTAP